MWNRGTIVHSRVLLLSGSVLLHAFVMPPRYFEYMVLLIDSLRDLRRESWEILYSTEYMAVLVVPILLVCLDSWVKRPF